MEGVAQVTEEEFGEFECQVEGCVCIFLTRHDLFMHSQSTAHGRMGDRFAEDNRRKFRFYSRQGRVKEEIYREQQSDGQQSLSS